MASQTTMNGAHRERIHAPPSGRRGLSGFLHDLITLIELQWRLITTDAQEGAQQTARPAVVAVVGLVLGCACLPMLLAATAMTLVETIGLSIATALWITVVAAAALAGILLLVGYKGVRARLHMFDRSRYEWRHNVEWMKDTLRGLKTEEHDA